MNSEFGGFGPGIVKSRMIAGSPLRVDANPDRSSWALGPQAPQGADGITVNPNTGMPFQTFDVFIRYRCAGIGNLVFMKPSLPREQQLSGGAYVCTTVSTQLQAGNQRKITIGFEGAKNFELDLFFRKSI